ncbi:MAG: MFS transporter [Cyanobacteria bacterium P01_C01_bin.120]
MRKFTFLWLTYLVSAIGNRTAGFAITLWVWDLTGAAMPVVLTGFFGHLPHIVASLLAGSVVDRANRKYLMILSRLAAVASTLVLLILYLSGHLAIWHLYVAALVKGWFEKFGNLSYRASITLLLPPSNYVRAFSMNSAIGYLASIVAPGIAGVIYRTEGLGGIFLVQLAAFAIVITILALVQIPQPKNNKHQQKESKGWISYLTQLWAELTFGVRYIWRSAGLRSLIIITTVFWSATALCDALRNPMILAKTGGSSEVLGAVITTAGIGGLGAAISLSLWGGFRRNVRGMLAGFVGAGIAKITFGLGQGLPVWLPAQFGSSLNFPLLHSSEKALLTAATPPEVICGRDVINDVGEVSATLLAGVLSDRVFEPSIQSPTLLQFLFAPVFGTGAGAGMAVRYVGGAIVMLLAGIFGFRSSGLRHLEKQV